jgi:hypothetical protein
MDEGDSRNVASLFEEAHFGGAMVRSPLLGTMEDTLRKVTDKGISLHRTPITPE